MPITFEPGCFEPEDADDPALEDGGWEAEPRFRVETAQVERAADALLVVAARIMRVGASGTEHDPAVAPPLDEWMPSTSNVTVDDDAAYVWADTSEWLSLEQAATMRRILVEELERAGVTAHVRPDYLPGRGVYATPWRQP